MFADYLHTISPYIFKLWGDFGPRWYGLAYLVSFFVAFYLLRVLVRRGYSELKEDSVADFILACAIFGVFLGGRLGFMLLYNFDSFIRAPWILFTQILSGGMASHGGILGVMIVTFIYARRKKISCPGIGDNLVAVAPIGIFFVRIANFINGELYGKAAPETPWAVKFPDELNTESLIQGVHRSEIVQKCVAASQQAQDLQAGQELTTHSIVELSRQDEGIQNVLGEYLTARHPSQIYQALLEGLLLFLILMAVRLKFKNLPVGILTGLFFALYAIFRIIGEYYRFPDSGNLAGVSKGTFYSIFMFIVAAGFFFWGFRNRKKSAETGQ